MPQNVLTLIYLVAGILFVLSLRGLSAQETARRGNGLGAAGMLLAVVVTLAALLWPSEHAAAAEPGGLGLLLGALVCGGLVGQVLAARVAMTAMPELVAVLHSFVGAAAVLVGIGSLLAGTEKGLAHLIEVFIGVLIGALTFTGSIIAFLKLRGTMKSKPLLLPGRHAINIGLVAVSLGLTVYAALRPEAELGALLVVTALAALLGVHLVMAIGGGDMPVVVSLLNSYSGWAASAAGFMLGNDLLIITGALVGSSGAILSFIMCKAMNRSIWSVIFGSFGEGTTTPKGPGAQPAGKVTETSVGEVASLLGASKSVIVIPGYGMAVAQAQHAVKEITTLLVSRGVKVRYAIHPVAGRLPGHMNVLLAEADVSYELVKEMEEINEEFGHTDVAIVIGANDIVNPSAQDDADSPIYGMPVLEAWKAGRVVMLKRSLGAGYAGVDNPLVYKENTMMLFGDAKQMVLKLLAALQGA